MTPLAPMLAIAAVLAFPAAAPAAPPGNDGFANAAAIGGPPASASGTTAEATSEAGEPQHGGGTGHSVWWRWTAPASRTVAIEACGGFDSVVAVYRGTTFAGLVPVASNSDALPLCGAGTRVVFPAAAGEVYSIAVDAEGSRRGPVTVWVRPAPANDNFTAATGLEGDFSASVDQENADATREPLEPQHAGNGGGHSLWYAWIVPAGGPATVDTCEGDLDTVLGIYRPALGGLTEVASNDNGCTRVGGSSAEFTALAGQTYWIAVDGRDGATGTFDLFVEGTPAPCDGSQCDEPEDDEPFEDDESDSERRRPRCSDRRDNDGDGRVDRADPGCKGRRDDSERGGRARPTARNDRLTGTSGRDRLCGLGGDDRIQALAGADTAFGDACGRRSELRREAAAGDDRIDGGLGHDRLFGGPGNDTIDARDKARDRVDCGPGRDTVKADKRDRLARCEQVRLG